MRMIGRQLQSQVYRRTFVSSSCRLDAQNFSMPALSPTMTEGNIATWRVKEGESFAAGDILLEIETDKATMDVEAQDAGVLVKIFQEDGSKGVRVGTRIAVIGEEGDDPKALDIPEDDSKPLPQEGAKETERPQEESRPQESKPQESAPKEAAKPSDSPEETKSSSSKQPSNAGQNKKYPLYPSVIALIHENHISDSDISKIPASGPNGRLLKGDVLAYLGKIPQDYSASQSARIEHLSHLDLSNIKIAAPPAPSKPTPTPESAAPSVPAFSSITIPISLSAVLATQKRIEDTIGVTIPLSTFLVRATDLANDDLPRTKASRSSPDDLFNAVLGLDILNPKTSRGGYVPQITAAPTSISSSVAGGVASKPRKAAVAKQPDIIDILSGKAKPLSSRPAYSTTSTTRLAAASNGGALNMFSVTVPKGEEKRARTFLERMKTVLQVEPGRLVL